MLDDIAAIQQRISDIQSRIATLNGALTPPPPDTTGTDSAGRSFDNVLANERARYGAAISPTDQTDAATPEPAPSYPTGLPGTAIPLGRRPYVPPASAGPLPSSTPATSGSLPLVPSNQEIVPIKTGGLSEYEPLIDRYAAANGLSPKLVRAVIKTESDGNPRDVSRAGAMGLMQLMPDNVREAGISDPVRSMPSPAIPAIPRAGHRHGARLAPPSALGAPPDASSSHPGRHRAGRPGAWRYHRAP